MSYVTFAVDTLATIGNTICYQLIVTPDSGDVAPTNNAITICTPVVNSYDPNDKQVIPQGVCEEQYTVLDGAPLTYTARFQNTGTAAARRVYILDTLSPLLSLAETRILSQSHDMVTTVLPGNVLRFTFDDINLEASSIDEPRPRHF